MSEILMPKLSDSMEEGLIVTWLVEEGQPFEVGDELVEIETDKAAMTYEAETAGLLEIVVAEGETATVGEVIAKAAEAGSPASEAAAESGQASSETTLPQPDIAEPANTGSPPVEVPASKDGHRATPLARRAAAVHEVEIGSISGSGPAGRVTKDDVLVAAGIEPRSTAAAGESAPAAASTTPASAGVSSSTDGSKGATRVRELSRLQGVIAKRMAQAKATVPEFQVQTEVCMDAAIELRTGAKGTDRVDPVPSYNDMIVKAAGLALENHPTANGSFQDGQFLLHERINIGVAVAADDALVVPTVMDANSKTLREIASDTRRLAERVRSGEITPPELSGGTFTISNLGMFGMTAISPVINLPQAAILGVGAMRDVLQRSPDGEIVDATMMTLSLTCDHRILYGADASRFLAEIKDLIEAPLSLVL